MKKTPLFKGIRRQVKPAAKPYNALRAEARVPGTLGIALAKHLPVTHSLTDFLPASAEAGNRFPATASNPSPTNRRLLDLQHLQR
jgi:hypothetical protein